MKSIDWRKDEAWDEFGYRYYQQLREMMMHPPEGYTIMRSALYRDRGPHPIEFTDYECEFAARMLADCEPVSVLDVGSYRHFVIGLTAGHEVTSVDIRARPPLDNGTTITCDAKQLDIPSNKFDAVVSLCSLEHFGLGRYGDGFDLGADKKAFIEMQRVLKPGGILIFTTTITRGAPCVFFNAGKRYSYEMIQNFCRDMILVKEEFFSLELKKQCTMEEVTDRLGDWDTYCGCWRKIG